MRNIAIVLALAVTGLAAPANAAVDLSAIPGMDPHSGPALTYDFDSTAAPVVGGSIVTGTTTTHAQPFGSAGNYWSVGPADGAIGVLSLAAFSSIDAISFIWGSVDAYNSLEVLDRAGNVIKAFTGADAAVNPDGNQTSPVMSPVATLAFSGADRTNIGSLRFKSTSNAFELDNFSISGTAVPEPATWLSMIVGFGMLGGFMRRRKTDIRVKFA